MNAMRVLVASGGQGHSNLKVVRGRELNFRSLGADALGRCLDTRVGLKMKSVFTSGHKDSVRRMTEHRKKKPQKSKLTFKWVESDPFELKPAVRPGAGSLPTSDTAFLLKSKLPVRQHRVPRT